MVAAKHQESGEEGETKRIFCRAKSNIGPDDGGFEYDLPRAELSKYPGVLASYALWDNSIEGTARELLAAADDTGADGDGETLSDAKQFLLDLLSDGPLTSKAIKADSDGAGYAWRTIQRAQKALRIEAVKEGFGRGGAWVWKLPETLRPPQNTKERQQNNMAILGNFGGLKEKPAESAPVEAGFPQDESGLVEEVV
jgi:putative DNA primase/helicase